jgi:ankyrin repeat protein
MLENKMIDINKKDPEGLNAFWIACICGNGAVMKLLADRGIDVLCKDKFGNNALHIAAKYGKLHKIVKFLIESKFPLEEVNQDGDTALHIAA